MVAVPVVFLLSSALATLPDGKALYREHCAGCHGKDGGGDGVLAKDLRFKPRAFKEGKFAFGNTFDAMVKTVNSGVPGEDMARMPAFKSVLTAAEVDEVVEYVRTLMPLEPERGLEGMKLEVGDGARIVRGVLAPLEEGGSVIPRGLLVGVPGGFSFEYANDQAFHLVAVRRGEFLMRSDWQGRGGRPLTPLGAAIWIAPKLERWTPFAVAEPGGEGKAPAFAMTSAKLRSTTAIGPDVELTYDLVDASGAVRAHVVERPRHVELAGAAGIVQTFELEAAGAPVAVMGSIALATDPSLSVWTSKPVLDAPPGSAGAGPKHGFEQQEAYAATGWWLTRSPKGDFSCVRVTAPDGTLVTTFNGETHDSIDVQLTIVNGPVRISRVLVTRPEATPDQLAAMSAAHATQESTR